MGEFRCILMVGIFFICASSIANPAPIAVSTTSAAEAGTISSSLTSRSPGKLSPIFAPESFNSSSSGSGIPCHIFYDISVNFRRSPGQVSDCRKQGLLRMIAQSI